MKLSYGIAYEISIENVNNLLYPLHYLYRARYLSVENNIKVVRDTTIFWDHLN